MGGSENNVNGYIITEATYKFTMRCMNLSFTSSMNEKSIITFANNDYNVTFIDADQTTPRIAYVTAQRRN